MRLLLAEDAEEAAVVVAGDGGVGFARWHCRHFGDELVRIDAGLSPSI